MGEDGSDPREKQRTALNRRVLNKTQKLEKEGVERGDGRHKIEKSNQGTDKSVWGKESIRIKEVQKRIKK